MFLRTGGELYCDGVSLNVLAAEVGTAFYVYSWQSIEEKIRQFEAAFQAVPTLLCYALKANSNWTILQKLAARGVGADVVSLGELEKALRAGAPPQKIVFSGVGKTDEELSRALEVGIFSIHVESFEELSRLERLASRRGVKASMSLRINPNIDAATNPYIATGLYENKFGIPEQAIPEAWAQIRKSPSLRWMGLSCHIGSQILSLDPFQQALDRLLALAKTFKAQGAALEHLDLGGGLGVRYDNENPPSVAAYAGAINQRLVGAGMTLVLEPGRSLVAEAGGIVCRVIGTKQTPKKKFLVVDAAMNDLIRPCLYGAFHSVEAVTALNSPLEKVDVVGPICETGDFLAVDRMLPAVQAGELLFIGQAGAYAASMASNYNLRPRLAEILVEGEKFQVIRRRERLEDLWAEEI